MRGWIALALAFFPSAGAQAGVGLAEMGGEVGRAAVLVPAPSFSQTLLAPDYSVDAGQPVGRFEGVLPPESGEPGPALSPASGNLAAAGPAPFPVAAAPSAPFAVSGRESRSGAEGQAQREPEPVPDPVRETAGTLVEEIEKGGDPQTALSSFYVGDQVEHGYQVESADHDYSLIGPPGDKIVLRLRGDARAAIKARTGETRVDTKNPRRIWTWIMGDQGVSLVPLRKWWVDRLLDGRPPSGWHMEHLEMSAIRLNASIQSFYAQRIIPVLPSISLGRTQVLEDSFLGDHETRATVEERLRRQRRPDIRDTGALNLLGTIALAADLLQYPKIAEQDILAAILHERLASLKLPHRDVVRMVFNLLKDAFGVPVNPASALAAQRHLVYLVKQARAHADRAVAAARGPAPAPAEDDDGLFDGYVLPFEPSSVAINGLVGYTDKNGGVRRPYKTAFVRFVSNRGTVALGISELPRRSRADAWKRLGGGPAERPITFFWNSEAPGADWEQIRLNTNEEIRNDSIDARIMRSVPGPMISHQRFRKELLDHFDRAVRAYLEDASQSAEDAAFVEEVYLSFRHNFGLLYSDEDLPEFRYVPARRPPAS